MQWTNDRMMRDSWIFKKPWWRTSRRSTTRPWRSWRRFAAVRRTRRSGSFTGESATIPTKFCVIIAREHRCSSPINTSPGSPDIPRCKCGASRTFEFQVMPQILNSLGQAETATEGLDFGTILIYTCSKNCHEDVVKYQPEFAWVQCLAGPSQCHGRGWWRRFWLILTQFTIQFSTVLLNFCIRHEFAR